MMNQPPIDTLVQKMGNNKYKLCCVMQKRAKEIEKTLNIDCDDGDKKSITCAAEEIMDGIVVSSDSEVEE